MPPGTGDVQMGLARMLPRTDLLIVTTPALAAQKVAIRAADMARRSFLRVAGVIENMSAFTCDHGTRYALFGEGGGQTLADEIGVELLGQVPLEPAVAAGGDAGTPVVLDGDGPAAERLPGHRRADRHRDGAAGGDGRLHGPCPRRRRGRPRPEAGGGLTHWPGRRRPAPPPDRSPRGPGAPRRATQDTGGTGPDATRHGVTGTTVTAIDGVSQGER